MTRYKIEEHLQPKNLYKGSVESQLKASKDIKKKLVHETTFFNGSQNKLSFFSFKTPSIQA